MKCRLAAPVDRLALLCIDLQEEHRQDPRYLVEGFDAMLARVAALQVAARAHGVAVMHAQYVVDRAAEDLPPFHPLSSDGRSAFSDRDSPLSGLCPETRPDGAEAVLTKSAASMFAAGLDERLRRSGIEWVMITGVWTEACVDATVKDAVARGYRVILVKDACGSASGAMHQTAVLNLANRLYGGAVVDTARAIRLLAGQTADGWMVQGSVPLRFTYDNAAALYDAL
ncbi:isochorismatase family protein [Gluconacetobacter azotocaptans]|uniref:isochorismatase family protein n=1 Tax=Gluconacetobacter azotocaptans TaxID=142834 RepID=UPI001956504A|nr:isochorismatase family protein [Gluconacetobacter azotocaptans]MBM9402908.1 isochorismatase family protein [Gluconacetobacter azotocaptans]